MADSIWWTKMLHKEDFCAHFCEMTDAEIVADIRKSIASFLQQRDDGEDFGARMVKKAKDRLEKKSPVYVENGKKGGRPPVKSQLPKNKQEVIEFAIDNGLDTDDASTWAEQNLKERKGKDKDGNPIMNWKGALTNYCAAMKTRRSA